VWLPDHLPDLAELERHRNEYVWAQCEYTDYLRWVGQLQSELGPDEGRLQVATDAMDASIGLWGVQLFGTERDRPRYERRVAQGSP
jgi:hypothetical protein